jgi:sugar phosphate isomerase/epimerase
LKIALQLYTIRRELAENPERSLEKLKGLGIEAVEVAPLTEGLSAARLAGMLRSLELSVAAIHCDLPRGEGLKAAVDLAQEFDCRGMIWHGWPRDPRLETLAGLDGVIEEYNEAQENAAQRGLELGLHNHWWEFELLEGFYPYKEILEKVSPEIFFEIDTYWVRTAGMNPTAVLREMGDRVRFLHLKDGPAVKGEPMVGLGAGVMDFPAILKAAGPKVEGLVIELDECATDIWEAIGTSVAYLKELGSRG